MASPPANQGHSDLQSHAQGRNIYHPRPSRASHTVLRRKTPNKTQGDKHPGIVHPQPPSTSELPPLIPELKPGGYGDSFYLTISTSLEEKGYCGYLLKRTSTALTIPPSVDAMDPGAVLLSAPYKAKYQLISPNATEGESSRARPRSRDTYGRRSESRDTTPTPTNRFPKPPDTPPHHSPPPRDWTAPPTDLLRRQQSIASRFNKALEASVPKSYLHRGIPGALNSRERLLLERVESIKSGSPPRSETRVYTVTNAIVTPVVHLARVMSISSFDDEGMDPPSPSANSVVLHRLHSARHRKTTSSLIANGQSITALQQGSKVKRAIREILKQSFKGQNSQISGFDEDTSDEEEIIVVKKPPVKTSVFQRLKPKVKEAPKNEIEESPRKISLRKIYCSSFCDELGCLHDCEVLHIKNKHGHDCLLIENVDGQSTVIAGTFEGLMLHLCNPINRYTDRSFTDRFLRVCGGFAKISDILGFLIKQFSRAELIIQKQRVIDVINRWFQLQPEDLLEEGTLSPLLAEFIGMLQAYDYTAWFQVLQASSQKFEKKLATYREQWAGRIELTTDPLLHRLVENLVRPMLSHESNSEALAIDTDDLANYLAALDLILFRDASENRTVRVWLHKSTNMNPDSVADTVARDRIQRILRRSEMIRDWVFFELSSAETDEMCSKRIEKFIDLAEALKDRGNFQTTIPIIQSLLSHLGKLEEGQLESISAESMKVLERLKLLQISKGYTAAMAESSAPVVPVLQRFLHHVQIMEEETSYFSEAAGNKKKRMDIKVEDLHHQYFPSGCSSTLQVFTPRAPGIIDIAKRGMFFHQIDLVRRRAWKAHDFGRLSRAAWVFKIYKPGRFAFCRKTVALKCSTGAIDIPTNSNKIMSSASLPNGDQKQFHTPRRLPPSPPITPPSSTYFSSNRSSSLDEIGELDWMSEVVEKRILQAHANGIYLRRLRDIADADQQ